MRLSDCFTELMAYTISLVRSEPEQAPDFEKVRADMERLIQRCDQTARQAGFAEKDYDLARFAVFAWIDEAIMSSGWPGRGQWQRQSLQRVYYQTADAGELFFDRLNSLGLEQRDVREVYYLCLALGFSGQYCNPGDEILLEQLKTSNLKLLFGSSVAVPSLDQEKLFAGAYARPQQKEPESAGGRLSPMTVAVAASPVVLFGLLYLVYNFILSHVGQTLISTVP